VAATGTSSGAKRLSPLLVLLVLAVAWWIQQRYATAPAPDGPGGSPPNAAPPAPSLPRSSTTKAAGYAPASDAPADAIPGGGLAAHEGLNGAHTLDRHVGRSLDDLRRRARDEHKREVSTFPDAATADRAVAAALYRNRAKIATWLGGTPDGLQDFDATLPDAVGTVWRADRERAQPGRTVLVVLAASPRFAEGFRIHTAYVTLP
jgi:hypothetical protein